MFDPLRVPHFARATDYLGVWAIDPSAGAALWAVAAGTDLTRHVAEAEPVRRKAAEPQTVKASSGQRVGVVTLAGTLMKAVSSMSGGTSTVQARRELRQLANDPDVAAIVLAIDSPGGTVSGTADLGAEVASAAKKKPVYSFISDMGASAAYWVASQADRVFANDRTALVGSIGTLAVVYDLSGAAEKAGVKTLVFGTGPLKGAGAPGAPVGDDQQAYFRGLVADAQVSFDAAVKRGRDLTDAKLEKAKTGGVFGASEALDRGLIDGIKAWEAVVEEVAAEARRAKRQANQQPRATGPVPVRSATVEENVTTAGAAVADAPKIDVAAEIAAFRKAKAAEMTRVAAIEEKAKGHPGIIAEAVAKNWTPDQAELAALKADLPNHVKSAGPHIGSRSHERDCSLDVLQGALLLRCGAKLDGKVFASEAGHDRFPAWLRADVNDPERNRRTDLAHKYKHLSAIDLCREAVRLDGREVPFGRDDLLKAATSGGSLTNIFTTSVNAQLLLGFMEAPDTTGGWTRAVDVSDFKTQERPRMTTLGDPMKKLPRGGEADHERRSDQGETYKIARYASQFVVDEQDLIDDALNALATMPGDMAKKAARLRPDLVYAILLANPTLAATGRALFNATDANLGTTSALAASTLKAAVAAMMLVRENQINLGITPTHLLLPPTLRFTGKELINSTQIIIAGTAGSVTERGNVNTLADENLQIVADPRLENGVVDPDSGTIYSGSSSTWYMASTMVPTIEVAYRTGTGRAPMVRSFTLEKGKWGLGWDINLDIGAKAMEWRGLRKTTA